MTGTPSRDPGGRTLAGFLCALAAGSVWGTTGPLSTALYAEGQHLAGIGFWRVLLGLAGLALLLFNQRLAPLGWLGLALAVGGVAASYAREERAAERPAAVVG